MSRRRPQPDGEFDQIEKELTSLRPLPIDRSIAEQFSLKLDKEPPIAWYWRAGGLVAVAAGLLVVVLAAIEKVKSTIRVPGPAPVPSQNEMAEQIDPEVRPFTLAAYQAAADQGPRALESLLDEQVTRGGARIPPVGAPTALNRDQPRIMTAGGATVN